MANHRTYTDDQLRSAIQSSTSWSGVLSKLGKNPAGGAKWVQARAAALGIDTSGIGSHMRPVSAPPSLFSRSPRLSGRAGLSIACRWFLERDYNVSIPVEPAAYDLIAESDAGLQRVQVKTTNHKGSSGRFAVQIKRRTYDATLAGNAAGRCKGSPYSPDEVDQFFIVTTGGACYLIPILSVPGITCLHLDVRYGEFLVERPRTDSNRLPGA